MMTQIEATTKAIVVIPTYNEVGTIGDVIARVFMATKGGVDILVVDDSSPDGTAKLVEAMAASDPALHLVQRPDKLGLAGAYILGFQWALERDYDVVVQMDADLSHDPSDVPRLLAFAAKGTDLVIGSRYVAGGGVRNWGVPRRILSRGGNAYVRLFLRLGICDVTAGFRAYRAAALRAIDFREIESDGYAFQIEMARRVRSEGGGVVELPIIFTERAAGNSKMTNAIVVEALVSVARWGLQRRPR